MREISSYYSQVFTSTDEGEWEEKLNGIPSTISDSMNSNLIKPVDDREIKKIVFAMNPTKALGMDDMTPCFFSPFGI